jgi:hypothetical protein
MTSRNKARTQVDPALLEQFMKQQEAKYVPPPPLPQTTSAYSVPTDFVALPSKGEFYSEGHPWHKKEKVEVKFMTTKEEDILTSPAYAREGLTFNKLIESVAIDAISADSLLVGDKNAILVNARKNAYGKEYDFYALCENCLEGHEIVADLEVTKIKDIGNSSCHHNPDGTFVVDLPQSKDKVHFRLFFGEDEKIIREQEEARKKHKLPFEKIIAVHRQMIIAINENKEPNYIEQYIQKMLIRDSRALQKAYNETKPDVIVEYSFNCKSCDHRNQGGVPFGADFFWPDE